MRRPIIALVLAASTPVLALRPVPDRLAWYDVGHRLVARVAMLRLTSHADSAARDLLDGESLADASVWADRIRGQRRETAPLHYVNIPLEAERYVPTRDCPGGECVIAAVESDRRTLADSNAPVPARAEALRFLIHFIGDLHQPLHVSDNNDRGGNDRRVTFFGSPKNLHQVWDGELIQAAGLDEPAYLEHLRAKMDSLDLTAFEQGSVVDWAMEGHRIARENAYQLPADGQLGEPYLTANLPVVDLALIKAGVRLAKVLNEALQDYHPAPSSGSRDPVYSDGEAAAHVGEVATVVGIVFSVRRSKSGNTFLNFGANYPNQTFSGVILGPQEPALRDLDSLTGRRVGVHGLIRLYRGQAEIQIERAEQIGPIPSSPGDR